MNIQPRFDVYRSFDKPDEATVVATGVIAGELRTMSVAVTPEDHTSLSEDALRAQLEPMLREWWSEALREAA